MRTFLISCLVALPAGASSAYPAAVQTHVTAPASPPCTLCHVTAAGGAGTCTTLFGTTFRGTGGGGGTVVPPMTYGCGSNAVPGLMGFGSLLLVLALSRRR